MPRSESSAVPARRLALPLAVVAALAAAPTLLFGCEDELGPVADDGNGTQGKPCEQEKDCEDDNPCTVAFCFTGTCDVQPVQAEEQPGAQQVDGDCMSINCKDGQSVVEPDDGDAPDDDGIDCLIPACEAGTPTQVPAEVGEFCQQGENLPGVCGAEGTCSCVAPSPGAPHFVDPENGTDDAMHGGAWGGCAYRTLAYALQQADGPIALAPVTFSEATGETFPIILTGSQQLYCYDQNSQTAATLSGSGTLAGETATLAFAGGQNRIEGCIVSGAGADHCIAVTGDGTAGGGHEVRFSQVTGCQNGVSVMGTGDGIAIRESQIDNNAVAGVAFAGGDKLGDISDNAFASNGTDITCDSPSPDLGGGNNGAPSCTGCQNCPF